MYILPRRYHLLHLLVNNTGATAVIAAARTSARLDKTCITNQSPAIPERSADRPHPCLPFPGPQEAQEEAGSPSDRQNGPRVQTFPKLPKIHLEKWELRAHHRHRQLLIQLVS